MRWNLRGHSRSASIALLGRFHRSSFYWCARWMRSIRPSQHTYSKILAYEIGRSASRRARHGSRLVAMTITRWTRSLVGASTSVDPYASSRTDAVLFIQTRSHFQEKEKRIQQSKIYKIYAESSTLPAQRPSESSLIRADVRISWPGDPPLARSQVHRLVHHWCQGVRTPRGRFGPQPFVK